MFSMCFSRQFTALSISHSSTWKRKLHASGKLTSQFQQTSHAELCDVVLKSCSSPDDSLVFFCSQLQNCRMVGLVVLYSWALSDAQKAMRPIQVSTCAMGSDMKYYLSTCAHILPEMILGDWLSQLRALRGQGYDWLGLEGLKQIHPDIWTQRNFFDMNNHKSLQECHALSTGTSQRGNLYPTKCHHYLRPGRVKQPDYPVMCVCTMFSVLFFCFSRRAKGKQNSLTETSMVILGQWHRTNCSTFLVVLLLQWSWSQWVVLLADMPPKTMKQYQTAQVSCFTSGIKYSESSR